VSGEPFGEARAFSKAANGKDLEGGDFIEVYTGVWQGKLGTTTEHRLA
jgi:hypothetical protein